MKKSIFRATILVLCMVLLGACTACGQKSQPENPPKYTLYFGLCDADTGKQLLTMTDAQEAARDIILDNGCGYTEYAAYGAYQSGNAIIHNDTLVYEICFADAAVVEKIAAEIQAELNLMPALIAEGTTSYRFAG